MDEHSIDIGKDFNPLLGGRTIKVGPYSGELFYKELLEPKFRLAIEEGKELHIYLDNAKGYASSFLDQSFGELARNYNKLDVEKTIHFHTKFFKRNIDYLKMEIWAKNI
jgi:hypothetical protein